MRTSFPIQVNINYDALIRQLVEYQKKMATSEASLQAQVHYLTQCLSQSSQWELELSKSERALKEHCETLEKQVSNLEGSQNEDRLIVNSLTSNLTHCRARLDELLNEQTQMGMQIAQLKSNLMMETGQSCHVIEERDQVLS